MSLFMSNNGAKQNTHTHNCVSPPGKVFFLSHFFSSFIRHRNNFPLSLSGSRDSKCPVVVVLLGTAQYKYNDRI
jgi:hypothetical protein